MKCSIIKKRDGQMWQVAFDEFDTIGDARVKLSDIADNLAEVIWGCYDDILLYDVYTYKIVKTSSIKYDHSYGYNDYITY